MITNDHIAETTYRYLESYPDDKEELQPFLDIVDGTESVATRSRLAGHATASGFVLDDAGRVLHIEHRALGRLLQPGGHIEPKTDETLIGAARREVAEETGLEAIAPFDGIETPVCVDIQRIPDSPVKKEPEHWHFDFQFVFVRTDHSEVRIQESEVAGHRWVPLNELDSVRIQRRIRAMRGV
ncbi:NUDIX hydrolase [Haloglycomyces albus]|uniref:NUDIX hydrolase n=1 Tax=Haloglycomyces albus TaxID=526067 RepID=UPI00046D63A9|nr:NUDIX domain-containing protein [Haloglycomyces albus]